MLTRKAQVLSALFCCVAAAAHASVDCRVAQLPVERVICCDAHLAAEDETLGRLYRNALGRLSNESVGRMRADQVQWLAWVQQLCPPTSDDIRLTAACMTPLYKARNNVLRTAIVRQGGTTFYMRSQYIAVPDNRPEFKQYGKYPGVGTLEAQWPQADSNEPAWRDWNTQLEQQALHLAAGDDDAPQQSTTQPLTWSDNLAVQRDTELTARLKQVEHGRVSTWLAVETMGIPAAHPSDSFGSNIWLLKKHRLLEPHDVFAAGDQWKTVLGKAAFKALTSGNAKAYLFQEVNGPDAKPLQAVLTKVHNWVLEPDGLHISYPDYAVAPRMARPEDTVLSWSVLKSVLAPDFVQP